MTDASMSANAQHVPLRIYIAADSAEEAERLARVIRSAPDMRVAGRTTHAADIEEFFSSAATPADVLITDIMLSDADLAPLLGDIKKRHEKIDILIYTLRSQEQLVFRSILAGATGYLLQGGHEDLVTSVRLLRGGGSPVSPSVARSVLRAISSLSLSQLQAARAIAAAPKPQPKPAAAPQADTRSDPTIQLSQRESEIIMLLAKGISFSDIGSILGISPHTVTAHIKKIYKKLGVHSRGEAVYEATCAGLISI